MSEPKRVVLVGASGLVGQTLIARAAKDRSIHLVAIARRPLALPLGGQMSLLVDDPAQWPEAIAGEKPDAIVVALGTTWRKAGRDEAAFRAVDQHLVLACARAAKEAGARQCIAASSVGASATAAGFYLRVKGEVEQALAGLDFERLDLLRPGLLRGPRGGDRRLGERLAIAASPMVDRMLHGPARRYRSISAEVVADAIRGLLGEIAGRFVHEHDAIRRAAR